MRIAAGVGRAGAGQHVHERRLAGPVVADKADAFAALDREIDAVESADGAVMLLDAVQGDDALSVLGHEPRTASRSQFDHGAVTASCWP